MEVHTLCTVKMLVISLGLIPLPGRGEHHHDVAIALLSGRETEQVGAAVEGRTGQQNIAHAVDRYVAGHADGQQMGADG